MSEDRIKLFVGTAPNGEDAESQMVLEYTARKNSSLPIDIVWMKHSADPDSFWSGWQSRRWPTPFSGFRWAIPAACNYEGQAIYMDSDMIILGDLAELWNEPWNDTAIVMGKGGWRFCVCKWNCDRIEPGKNFPPIEQLREVTGSHQQMFGQLSQRPDLQQVFDRQWNNFDGENDNLEDVKILHYTDMSTQPHAKYAVPRLAEAGQTHWFEGEFRKHRRDDVVALFDREYNAALVAEYTVEQYVPDRYTDFKSLSQAGYRASNGFDGSRGE